MNGENAMRQGMMRLICGLRILTGRRAVRAARREEGGTLVEMALVLSILFAMIFGIVEFSYALYAYNYVADAAREGARWAIVRGNTCYLNTPALDHCGTAISPGATNADIQAHVVSLAYPGIDTTDYMTVSTTWITASAPSADTNGNPISTTFTACGTTSACKAPGNQVQVNVTYSFHISVPFSNPMTLPLQSTSTMVISQ
jgi:Flp pilus assembly protein TadG